MPKRAAQEEVAAYDFSEERRNVEEVSKSTKHSILKKICLQYIYHTISTLMIFSRERRLDDDDDDDGG
jgi:hypothetical protein